MHSPDTHRLHLTSLVQHSRPNRYRLTKWCVTVPEHLTLKFHLKLTLKYFFFYCHKGGPSVFLTSPAPPFTHTLVRFCIRLFWYVNSLTSKYFLKESQRYRVCKISPFSPRYIYHTKTWQILPKTHLEPFKPMNMFIYSESSSKSVILRLSLTRSKQNKPCIIRKCYRKSLSILVWTAMKKRGGAMSPSWIVYSA